MKETHRCPHCQRPLAAAWRFAKGRHEEFWVHRTGRDPQYRLVHSRAVRLIAVWEWHPCLLERPGPHPRLPQGVLGWEVRVPTPLEGGPARKRGGTQDRK